MLDTVALVRGDFDCDHTLVTAFIRLRLKLATKLQKKVQRFRTEILKDESTRNRYRMNLDLALKTLLENSSMNTEERDLDALAKKRSEIFRQTAKTVLGRANELVVEILKLLPSAVQKGLVTHSHRFAVTLTP
ncbi:hypothetical protein QYM36_007490, partial [Artemia franciscana]